MDYFSQASGTRNKYWVQSPSDIFGGKKFLFKESKTVIGELWAEKVVSEIGKHLGLNMMNVEFAKLDGKNGVIMENFVEQQFDLQDGGSLLTKSVENFKVDDLSLYTIENIMKEIVFHKMEDQFIEMCLFDFLIASSDRHCENWGFLHCNGVYSFAPIYDNGDSLGFNVTPEKLSLYEADIKAFEGFTNRSKTLISIDGKKKPKATILLGFLKANYPISYSQVIARYSEIDYTIVSEILGKVPNEIMSEIYKKWVLRLIKHRMQILKNF